jgi:glycosyltransferase involved in cell wall biosynthesis
MGPSYDVVVPSAGRPSLSRLLEALAAGDGPLPESVLVVIDGGAPVPPRLTAGLPPGWAGRVRVLRSEGRGPGAARNVGWRAGRAEWVAFLDDDVVPRPGWRAGLARDVSRLPAEVHGSQGRVSVPLPRRRRPTDWERNVAGLEHAVWATADMAYRRSALEAVGGFDERFVRAYREDADLGLRVVGSGGRIERGARGVEHPVRPAGFWVSVRLQAGNADDALMSSLHGRDWRRAAHVPRGRRPRHLATVAAALAAAWGLLGRAPALARAGGAAWALGTAELAWTRIAPGPRTRGEVARMLATSVVLPAAAAFHWLLGWARVARAGRRSDAR